MKSQDLPQDNSPLSPWEYWRESFSAWSDFSQRTAQIMASQLGQSRAARGRQMDPDADTMASELLRSLSDLNLRHWENTARLLESFPAWMNLPNTLTGSALVDWYDNLHRNNGLNSVASMFDPRASEAVKSPAPETLTRPDGEADDLTRIKGIGPKRSKQLNELGIYHFRQIAAWTEPEIKWVDDYLASPGRVSRDEWVQQARLLSANGSDTQH
ncbi:MAG: hypothetical protein HRT82_07135 [Henriciella sp.]|nr:hypothetical protein [Henriciella sp.]